MNNFFRETNPELLERFEIIFDRATSEKMAKSNALDFYNILIDENPEIDIDLDEIINIAESYGYDFDDFEEMISTDE